MMYGNWGYGGPGFFGMGWGMLLFWGVVIVGVILLLRWRSGSDSDRPPAPPNQGALEILAQRYARGEIERDEFEQKRRDLGGT